MCWPFIIIPCVWQCFLDMVWLARCVFITTLKIMLPLCCIDHGSFGFALLSASIGSMTVYLLSLSTPWVWKAWGRPSETKASPPYLLGWHGFTGGSSR